MDDKTIKLFSTSWETIEETPAKAAEAKDDRTLHFIATKEIKDRDSEIVAIKGLDINNFKKNPVILLNHNIGGLPIGKAISIWKKEDELHVKIKFATFEEYELADTTYKLIKGGYIKALSIRFLPDYEKIEYIDPDKRSKIHRIYHKSELLEISVVTVPSNAASLLQAKSKMMEEKIISEDKFDEFIKLYDKDTSSEEEEEEATNKSVEDQIKELPEELNNILKTFKEELIGILKTFKEDGNFSSLDSKKQNNSSYFDDLFTSQESGLDSGLNLSNDDNEVDSKSKDMFCFLNVEKL